jgi:hypothetical protein
MKQVKYFGMAAVAVALLALGGTSASATVICKNNLNTEKCSEPYEKERKELPALRIP